MKNSTRREKFHSRDWWISVQGFLWRRGKEVQKCVTSLKNPLAFFFFQILKEDGLESFESLKHNTDMYSLPGAYRKIVIKPWNFSYKFTSYNDPNQDLIQSDIEVLRQFELRTNEPKVNGSEKVSKNRTLENQATWPNVQNSVFRHISTKLELFNFSWPRLMPLNLIFCPDLRQVS